MADLIETVQWEATIYQLETTDPVKGGNDGISNRQAKQLANRTAYLKQQVEAKATLASPTFTGTPKVPTADADTSTTQAASTEFVIGQAANTAPLMDGVAAVGTSKKFARQDHAHPTDTSRAPVDSPTFTGTPAAPTAATDTSTTQLATTAFAVRQDSLLNFRGNFHKLTAAAGGTDYTASATAETLVVADSSYSCIGLRNVSVSVNGANSGANGLDTGTIAAANWYYLHVIYNPTTKVVAGLLSLSDTAPTLPSGYTHFAAVQPLFIKSATTAFLALTSLDGVAEFATAQQVLSAGSATSVSVPVSLALAVPPNAYPIAYGTCTNMANTSSKMVLYEDSSGVHTISSVNSNGANIAVNTGMSRRMTQVIYYAVYSASYTGNAFITGFKWIP